MWSIFKRHWEILTSDHDCVRIVHFAICSLEPCHPFLAQSQVLFLQRLEASANGIELELNARRDSHRFTIFGEGHISIGTRNGLVNGHLTVCLAVGVI